MDRDPLKAPEAKRLILVVLESGVVLWTRHAEREMAKDKLTTVDVTNVLRAGTVRPPEFENGEWRYRVETHRLAATVVAFPDET